MMIKKMYLSNATSNIVVKGDMVCRVIYLGLVWLYYSIFKTTLING